MKNWMLSMVAVAVLGLPLAVSAETDYPSSERIKDLQRKVRGAISPEGVVTNVGNAVANQLMVTGAVREVISPSVTVTTTHQFAQAFLYTNAYIRLACTGTNGTTFVLPPPGSNIVGATRWLLNESTNALTLLSSNLQNPNTTLSATGSLGVLAVSTSQWRRLTNP